MQRQIVAANTSGIIYKSTEESCTDMFPSCGFVYAKVVKVQCFSVNLRWFILDLLNLAKRIAKNSSFFLCNENRS